MYMDAVIEVDEVRNVVDPNPEDGAIFAKAGAHGFKHRAVRPHLVVAIHARLRRWNPGKGDLVDGRVTIPAVNADARYVMFVAERHRLLTNHALLGDVWRPDDATP